MTDIIAKDSDIAGFNSNIGVGGGGLGTANQGRIGIDLKPRAERKRSVEQIMADLRPKLAEVPGVRVFVVNQPPINLGGQFGGRSTYQFTLQDTDTAEVYDRADVERRCASCRASTMV